MCFKTPGDASQVGQASTARDSWLREDVCRTFEGCRRANHKQDPSLKQCGCFTTINAGFSKKVSDLSRIARLGRVGVIVVVDLLRFNRIFVES